MSGESEASPDTQKKFAICINRRFGSDRPACGSRGSEKLADAIEDGVRSRNIDVVVERIVCFGMCNTGPNMRLVPGGEFHKNVDTDQIDQILDMLEETCGKRDPVGDFVAFPGT